MLDSLFNVTVTLRRRVKQGVKGDITFQEVLDGSGAPLPIKCRFERRRRRIYRKDGPELELDGTMICRKDKPGLPAIAAEDVIVRTDTNEAFKVVSIDEDQQLFSSEKYLRLALALTNLPTPQGVQE